MRAARLATASLLVLVAAAAPAAAEPARDHADEARLFYRVVACAGDDPVPEGWQKVVDAHCKWMAERIATFRKRYVDKATAFFAGVRPAGLPRTVVYPFGGGDLASALLTYPEATEITTISLEHGGDPTRLSQLTGKQLKTYLGRLREAIAGLFANSDSESVKLQLVEKGPIPGQLAFHITGAAVMGYRPVGLRYFTFAEDGSIDYYTDAEIAAASATKAKKKKVDWVDTDWSIAYSNLELTLEKVDDPGAPRVVHRHVAANLDDKHFDGSPLEKHLEAKGKVAMMTKAASYVMWRSSFSAIRTYVATHLAWMASDTTGLPPRAARQHGLEQEVWGKFTGAMLDVGGKDEAAFVKLFASRKHRKLGFRYGYRDAADHPHLVITRPSSAVPGKEATR